MSVAATTHPINLTLMTTATSPEALAAAFYSLASINHRVNVNAVASLTWITYDIVTCLDDEIELIWKTRWTIPKTLYITLRYYAPLWLMYQTIIHLTPGDKLSKLVRHVYLMIALGVYLIIYQSCETFPPLQAIGPVFLWILVDTIMMLRIRALYREQRSIVFSILFFLFATASVAIPITIYCFRLSRPIPAPPPFDQIAGCLVLQIDWNKMDNAKAAVISIILLNILYLLLTLHKFIESVRLLKTPKLSSIYTIFVGEGVAYFIGCVSINAVDIVFSSGGPGLFPFVDLAQFWLAAYYSYAGCHLILHLRSVNSSLSALSSFTDCGDLEMRFKPISATSPSRTTTNLHSTSQDLDGPIYELSSYNGPKAV
ncbi:hypothetical protein BJ912DRAFT_904712 [Pholiota molesta]|nr:hypothetical protein BJ912DRAFT_904712 [Pholiota molesta]